MKHFIRGLSVLAIVLLALASCSRSSGGKPSADAGPQTEAPATAPTVQPAAPVEEGPTGYALRSELALWDLVDGEARFKESLVLGEKLKLLGETGEALYNGVKKPYSRVQRKSGTEGWVRSDFVSSGAPAVVLAEKTFLYSQPDNARATGDSLAQLAFGVVQEDFQDAIFARVNLFDPQQEVLRPGIYLKREDLTDRPEDVQTAILLVLVSAAKSDARKEALLESALNDYPGSRFVASVEEALAAFTPAPAAGNPPTEPFFAVLVAADDQVNVRSAPDVQSGEVLARLQAGQKVEVEEKTRADFTADGVSAPWYRIREPAGWVFGALLRPEEDQ